MWVCLLISVTLQLSSLEGAYDKFREDNPGVGFFLVQMEGGVVNLLPLREVDKALEEDKVSACQYPCVGTITVSLNYKLVVVHNILSAINYCIQFEG